MKPIAWYKSLALSKNRCRYGYFLIEGRRAVDQILTCSRGAVEELLCTDETSPSFQLTDIPVRVISDINMKSVCTSKTPQGIAALVKIPQGVYTSDLPDQSVLSPHSARSSRVLLLEHVQDPGNVGTLIRTAAAFGTDGVILSDCCADPFSPKAVQSTAGSVLSLWIRKTERYMSIAAELQARGYKLIAADLGGSESHEFKDSARHILALGNEGAGLTGAVLDRCDYRIRIPISASGAESLNVASSGAICMFILKSLTE
jgi:TrmH family RNA methyltransferase